MADTFFFNVLDEEQSRKKLKKRFLDARDDFEQYLGISHQDDYEKSLEFIKLLALAFIPDKVVCCIKRNDEIVAVNMVVWDYNKVTRQISIENTSKNLQAEKTAIYDLTKEHRAAKKLKSWGLYGFGDLKTFLRINVNQKIVIEFMMPYKTNTSGVVIELFESYINKSRPVKDNFFSKLSDNVNIDYELQYFKAPPDSTSGNKNIDRKLSCFKAPPEVFESAEMHLKEFFPYLEHMLRMIENNIREIMTVKHQTWIYQHFENDEYTKGFSSKLQDFISGYFGFYVSVITEGKNKNYWEYFKHYSRDKKTVFSKIKEKMLNSREFGVTNENNDFAAAQIINFREKFYKEITKGENFPGFKNQVECFKDESTKTGTFKDIFDDELKNVFDFYWEHKTTKFFQSRKAGPVSMTRDTQLPAYMNYFYEEDQENKFDENQTGSDESDERDHELALTETTRFLFLPEIFSEFSAFPIIINKVYWGVILIFFGRTRTEIDPGERYEELYKSHRGIIKALRRGILDYAERGILAEFESFARKNILKVTDRKTFDERIKVIEREAGRNPLIPDIHVFYQEPPCKCSLTTKEEATFLKKSHSSNNLAQWSVTTKEEVTFFEKNQSIDNLDKCLALQELREKENVDYEEWDFSLVYPSGVFKYPTKTVKKKVCTIFSGTRDLKNFPSTIDFSCMAISDYIDAGWESVLTEEEKQKLYTRNAAVAIMLDTFSHNIAAHSMRHLLNVLEERERTHLNVWKIIDTCFPGNKDKKIEELLEVKNDEEWAQQPVGVRRYVDFLREKSTFWNGVISEIYTSWGTTLSLYQVMKKFADNYLYIGSIASDLGIEGVEFYIGINKKDPIKWGKSTLSDYHYPKKKTVYYGEQNDEKNWTESFSKPGNNDIEEKYLYFPGGLIGLHSFYTILENTLRNAKFLNLENKIIPLNLLIEERGSFYKIIVGIDCESKDKNSINEVKKLLEQSIIDKYNKAQKGGILQIKISAAMLRGYELNIFNETLNEPNPKLIDVDLETFEKKTKIFWEFYMWKAGTHEVFSGDFEKAVKKRAENPLRFKFLLIPPKERRQFETMELNKLPIRIVYQDSQKREYSIDELYSQWFREWTRGEELKLIYKPTSGEDRYKYWNRGGEGQMEFSFYHSGSEEKEYSECIGNELIGTRSNGIFEEQFFEKQSLTFKKENFPELVEVMYTSIYIMDNELFTLWGKICNRFKKEPGEMKNYSWNTLRLNVFSEVDDKDKLYNEIKKNGKKHFFVVHLSMIDILCGKNSSARNEFIEKALQSFKYVILTTGRGREDAYSELDKKYKAKSRFIYRNQFEKAFENALEIKGEEMFILKYFLVKTLLGG